MICKPYSFLFHCWDKYRMPLTEANPACTTVLFCAMASIASRCAPQEQSPQRFPVRLG